MSRRPLVLVSALAVGDYLLWNWSLNGNHDVLALIAGLTLPPLAVAALWLLTLSVTHLIADSLRRGGARDARSKHAPQHQRPRRQRKRGRRGRPTVTAVAREGVPLTAAQAAADARKLAA